MPVKNENIRVNGRKFLEWQRGMLHGQELLIGEDLWNLFEKANKALFEGQTIILLDDQGRVYSTMRRHPIDGYVITNVHTNPADTTD